jgi:hypothetical protein
MHRRAERSFLRGFKLITRRKAESSGQLTVGSGLCAAALPHPLRKAYGFPVLPIQFEATPPHFEITIC